ncbi:hypothetical protein P6P90_15695 [Ectobacillus antri]|jgi:uncharacterized membrane protein affecting hemolysin expression|uniref:Uncharacterized protein n=1 Tax=Ectobacillus antri TaxID=2486280 RepID=A0ABT6H9J4_9BACI|nr:hypothetical protein [Ectobacillus antri]MDG4658274.1 hypothetical protein [Ectobacillus antri]MDG5755345.1 hypothetical protein [Ectobacillus antri]
MPFLYFPEDKTEYIPAFIICIIFLIGAILTWRLFQKISKRDAEKFKELEKTLMNANHKDGGPA